MAIGLIIDPMKTTTLSPLFNPLITGIFIAAIITLLVLQKTLFIPLALGLLFAFLILPPVRRLEKIGIPRIPSILMMILLSIVAVIGIGALISFAGSQFISSLPEYQSSITQNTLVAQKFIEKTFYIPLETQEQWFADNINLLEIASQNLGDIASSITSVVTTFGLTFIYTFFILYYRNKTMVFFRKLLGQADEIIIFNTFKKLVHVVPSYLSGVFWVVAILTVVNSLGFWAIGIPNPLFFGALVALLNIIPYIGPLIGFGIVTFFAFVTISPAVALYALLLFLAIQFLENNFLTPNIAGSTININPLAAIVGIIIGSSLWGIVGTIIALPILGMIKIIADSIPQLEPWGYLIGDEGTEDQSFSWSSLKKLFHKK